MKKTVLAVLLVVGLMFTQQAWAVLLDFNMDAIHLATTSVSYAGGSAGLVGSYITVDDMVDLDDPSFTEHSLTGGILSFNTGAYTGSDGDDWHFGPGGSITLIGGIPDLGIANGTTLMSGYFSGTTEVEPALGGFKVIVGGFLDEKYPALASFYGVDINRWFGSINLQLQTAGVPGQAFTSSRVLSGDITNTPVPEPASMSLLGLGLVGFVGRMIRRKARA